MFKLAGLTALVCLSSEAALAGGSEAVPEAGKYFCMTGIHNVSISYDSLQSLSFFISAAGGEGICNVSDLMSATYPLTLAGKISLFSPKLPAFLNCIQILDRFGSEKRLLPNEHRVSDVLLKGGTISGAASSGVNVEGTTLAACRAYGY